MARLNREQLELIKEKFGVKNLWSFSKVSTFDQCTHLYFLKYVKKIRVKGDNCYTWWGTVSHDLIQGLYDGDHTYEEMIQKLEAKIVEYRLITDPKLKFPEESQFESYIANLRHYFTNVKQLPYKVINERPVLAVFEGLEKYVFQGYVDSEFVDEDGNFVILDYKTSSIGEFTGAKLLKKSQQLMIYAFGISTFGRQIDGEMKKFPLEKIKIRYDMMKYCKISYLQKNGTEKVTKAERRAWVAHIANPIRKDFEDVPKNIEKAEKEIAKLDKKRNAKVRTEEEKVELTAQIAEIEKEIEALKANLFDIIQINEMMEEAINSNSLSNLPQFIQDKYTVTDCYIDVELTQEIIEEFKSHLISTLDKIIESEKEEDKEKAFTRGRIEQGDSFYCTNLCDMKDHCSFYQEYKAHMAMFLDNKKDAPSDADILAMFGL
ncbi:PD-(D/E)XK nuclease family protein [Bacillus cereus group sp. MYBK139-2]|uniref:PD-(D/E)XK nuclease family protein n=1 Tax=unclassified Bacillus cereus group TaxID=2750818 RepID=UPI003F7AF6E5